MMSRYLKNEIQLEVAVHARLHDLIYHELHIEVENHPIELWEKISGKTALNLWLYYIMYASSYEKLELEFGVPHANYHQNFGAIRSVLIGWAHTQICIQQSYYDRLLIAADYIEDEELFDCTLVLDSVPFQFVIQDTEYNSYKLRQKAARVYQVASTMDSIV